MTHLTQTPSPGARVLTHRGDSIEFTLTLDQAAKGGAWLRTNIGNGHVRRLEFIRRVERDAPILARDWHDIPMIRLDEKRYTLKVSLLETGRVEAKAFFLRDGTTEPSWPQGPNTILKVEPAEYCCFNSIYCAFVRQFGPNRFNKQTGAEIERAAQTLESSGYHVIPQSGTFRDLIRELDFIIGKLHFRIILLLPIHPTPSTFARMGRFGSPYAGLNFRTVDPALSEFDRKTTPLEQFDELVQAVHVRCGKLFMDIPINHTGWASRLQVEHPEWFTRGADREFQSPGAWGVTWADLSKLDYSHRELWRYMADVFLHWCGHGVDGFRCDAGYMIPFPVWEYIVAKVREEYPDTIFLLEGLGGSVETMESLLGEANLDWAYSELFQNYDQRQVESCLARDIQVSTTKGVLVHFAETHDNNRLAAKSQRYAHLRTALTALCSQTGAFGITNGVEWFATEKISVHGAPSLNWGAKENQIDHLARLNAILETQPAFHAGAEARLIPHGGENCVALARRNPAAGSSLLVLANLNEDKSVMATWSPSDFGRDQQVFHDLASGREIRLERLHNGVGYPLAPGEALCLSNNLEDLKRIETAIRRAPCHPERAELQRLRAKALDILRFFNGHADISKLDADSEAARLRADPRAYFSGLAENAARYVPLTTWEWPRDTRRIVMVPRGGFLYVKAKDRFIFELRGDGRTLRHELSLAQSDGTHFAFVTPLDEHEAESQPAISISLYGEGGDQQSRAQIFYLPAWHNAGALTHFKRETALKHDCYALCANGRGAMAQVRAGWAEVHSKYDALLAANLNTNYPVDRHIMFTRCRAWLVYRGFSQEINRNCLTDFFLEDSSGVSWQFEVPSNMGKFVRLQAELRIIEGQNTVLLTFRRHERGHNAACLNDDEPIKLILRPDVEDRNCHETTKAYAGPEVSWHNAVGSFSNGFVFGPSRDRRLRVVAAPGSFSQEHEWLYMVGTPFDAERGLDQSTDMFSPGYFTLTLKGGEAAHIQADVLAGKDMEAPMVPHPADQPIPKEKPVPLIEATRNAMRSYVVKRDNSLTVIAGYPWFLDWGRDTLICLRGMIAAGMKDEAREILKQFARFESRGTLPNMIRGNDVSNRDTSDAPLWFFVACSDLLHSGDHVFLNADCGGRTIRQALHSIATNYVSGTPNGISVDQESGLVFSPSHFTWMDTNHPPGTPREGYPIEIQALWHAALRLLGQIDHEGQWRSLAERVSASISRYYAPEGQGYLADCLHAGKGVPAAKAKPDDALRPNQLLAITLGAVADKKLQASILLACEELLVPGAIRSLADRPVKVPLPIRHRGALLNNPANPYWGKYSGDEDTRRKPAYHNGTAWTWMFPSYCEAMFMLHGVGSRDAALSLLSSSSLVINQDCIGQIPELTDGDAPHCIRGCGAQAWGVAELHRVLAILTHNA